MNRAIPSLLAVAAALAIAGCGPAKPAVYSECMSHGSQGCTLTVYYRPATQACWYAPHGPAWQAPPADVQVGCYELAQENGG